MSRPVQLLLPRQFLSAMILHAQSEIPNECCGLLAGVCDGDVLRVEKHYRLVNEAASPIEYLSEPRSMFKADLDMRMLGLEIVAIYHSHPTSELIPSRIDLEHNYIANVVHFIVGLKDADPNVRGWWLTQDRYEEAAWQIVDEPAPEAEIRAAE